MSTPFISVVVPTYNRAEYLPGFFDALARMDFDPSRYEILVVNNGSTDGTAATLVQEERSGRLPLRFLTEPTPGPSTARNTGAAHARGEYIVFLDDDECVTPAWLAAYEKMFSAERQCLVQGRKKLQFEGKRPAWLCEEFLSRFSQVDQGAQPAPLEGTLRGGNFGIAKKVFEELGGFRSDLGPGGVGLAEDTEFGQRAVAAGYSLVYCPDASVTHLIPVRRTTRRAFLRRCYFSGLSQPLFKEYRENKLRMLLSFARTSVARLCRAVCSGAPDRRMYEMAQLFEHAGRVVGIMRQK